MLLPIQHELKPRQVFFKRTLTMFALASISAPALAYLDPGSGSAIMSAIIGFVVAVSMGVKSYWYKIKSWFGGSKATAESAGATEAEEAATPAQGNSENNPDHQA